MIETPTATGAATATEHTSLAVLIAPPPVTIGPSPNILGPIGIGFGIGTTIVNLIAGLLGYGTPEPATKQDLKNTEENLARATDGVKRLAWYGLRSLGSLLAGLAGIFTKLLGPLLAKLGVLAKLLKNIYTKVLVPLLKALQHARKILDDFYQKYMRPVLNAIQRVRRILQILKAFHVKWAGALDDKLATIEGKIIGPYLWVLRQLNGFGSWINVILTAQGAIQRAVFINTMYAYQRDWVNLFWQGQTATRPPSPPPPPGTRQGPATLAQVYGDFTTYTLTGGGPVAADVTKARDALLGVV